MVLYVARIDADGGDGRVSRGGVDALVSNSFIDGYTRRKRSRGRSMFYWPWVFASGASVSLARGLRRLVREQGTRLSCLGRDVVVRKPQLVSL